MKKDAYYNWDAAPKADSKIGYSVYDHAGLDPGQVPLPATNREASTALLVGQKKKVKKEMKKIATESLAKGFANEIQKLGFGAMGGMTGASGPAVSAAMPGGMGQGGVITSKSKKSLGPKIKIVSSKTRKTY